MRARYLCIGTYCNQRGGRSDFRIYATASSIEEARNKAQEAIYGRRSYMRALDMTTQLAPEEATA